jgi:hypothetical protein
MLKYQRCAPLASRAQKEIEWAACRIIAARTIPLTNCEGLITPGA